MEEAWSAKGKEYAILTDEISRAWSGMTTGQYKRLKGLTKENLRDNMTDLELSADYVGGSLHHGYFQDCKAADL